MKNKKLLTNLLFAVVILAIAAVLLVVRRVHASGSGLDRKSTRLNSSHRT